MAATDDMGMTAISRQVAQRQATTTLTVADAMQSPYVPETPGRSPVIPEEAPTQPQPELPGSDPDTGLPQDLPPQPAATDNNGVSSPAAPEALAVRIP